MDFLLRLFRNPKPVVVVISLAVLLLLILFPIPSRGDASELVFDAGSAVSRGETPVIGVNVKWPRQGPVNTDWEAGFHLTGSSTYRDADQPNAVTVYGMLVDGYKWFEMGLGFAYTNVEWDYHCQETFQLMAGARWSRLQLRYWHNSSGGSCKPNVGRDVVTLGWRF